MARDDSSSRSKRMTHGTRARMSAPSLPHGTRARMSAPSLPHGSSIGKGNRLHTPRRICALLRALRRANRQRTDMQQSPLPLFPELPGETPNLMGHSPEAVDHASPPLSRRVHTPRRIRALQRAHRCNRHPTPAPPSPSPFFNKLPGELRNKIYDLAFPSFPTTITMPLAHAPQYSPATIPLAVNKQWSTEARGHRRHLARQWRNVTWTVDLDAPEEDGLRIAEGVRRVSFSTARWSFTPAFRTAWTRLHPAGPALFDGKLEFVLSRRTKRDDRKDSLGPIFALTDVPTFATPASRREVLDKRYLYLVDEASDAARTEVTWEGVVAWLRWCVREGGEEWVGARFGGTTTVEGFTGSVGVMVLMGEGI